MQIRAVLFLGALLLATPVSLLFGAAPQSSNYALLIGCSAYPDVEVSPLAGAANDVVLMKRLLVERFGFPLPNVTVLAEQGGSQRPTRANVECSSLAWHSSPAPTARL